MPQTPSPPRTTTITTITTITITTITIQLVLPFNKPAPTDLNLLSSQRKKIHLKFNMSLSILQKKIYISKKVGAFHWRCNGIAKVIDFHFSEVMILHTIGISKNETAVHIVKYMCTALSFQRSRLYIIRSYSVEKSFPIKSNIHCISRLCAAIPRCILPSHTTPQQAAS